jgi:hypothetical protein
MKTAWWILTPLVITTFVSGAAILARRGFIPAAQSLAVAVLIYMLVFIALWGMQSHFIRSPEVAVPRPIKLILLAMTGGLLAQVLIILDALVRGKLSQKRVAVLYVRGIIGLLAGLVGVLIGATAFSGLEKLDDEFAVLCGVAGGGLGASVVNLARSRVFGEPKK